MTPFIVRACLSAIFCSLIFPAATRAGQYTNFEVSIYIPVNVVRGFPLLLMNRYSKGVIYVWTIPENFTDLYALPPEVTGAIKDFVMRGFPVRLDGPSQVALFAYDNDTFIVESFLSLAADVKISVTGNFMKLHNLKTGETVSGQLPATRGRRRLEFGTSFARRNPTAAFAMGRTATTSTPSRARTTSLAPDRSTQKTTWRSWQGD
jgi:hypothetical protein